jgi:hypothetical protein
MKNKIIQWGIIIGIAIIATILILKRCNKPSNQTIDSNIGLVKQKTDQIIINDSLRGIAQDVLITNDPKLIAHITDSLQKDLLAKQGIKDPTVLIKWQDRFIETGSTGKLRDSFAIVFDEILRKSKDSSVSKEELQAYIAKVKAIKTPFEISTKYRYEKGTVDYYGNIRSDSLTIFSEPTISVGEVKKNIFSRPKIKVVIGNKNPLIHSDSLQSIIYVKPSNPLQVSIGPQVLIDSKGNYAGGVGMSFKKGFLDFKVGYLLINKIK